VTVCGAVLVTLSLCFLIGLVTVRIGEHLSASRHGYDSPAERTLTEQRSTALLRDLLTEHEYEQVTLRGYLEVASPSNGERIYRIPRDGGLVRVYERGTAVGNLCVQPAIPLPSKDVIVVHKLMIQGSEQAYLARANRFPADVP
jgi:hypothetical protein